MDPIVIAFGTALVASAATDTWQHARDAVTRLWHRVDPRRSDDIGRDLDLLREGILQARQEHDTGMEHALEDTWQLKLQQLMQDDLVMAAEVQQVLDAVLSPSLTAEEQRRIQAIITGAASSCAHLHQAGRDVNNVSGSQYIAGRDLTVHRS